MICTSQNLTPSANKLTVVVLFFPGTRVLAPKILVTTYKTYVRLTVKYASTVWDPNTCRNINKLKQVQRHSARYVTGNRDYKCSVTRMIRDLGWPIEQQHRRNSRLILMYKIINHQMNTAFSSKCSLSQSITTGHASRTVQPQCSCAAYTNSFFQGLERATYWSINIPYRWHLQELPEHQLIDSALFLTS